VTKMTSITEFNRAESEKLPLLVKVCRGEAVARPPIWMMRQAGRYLPEYQAIRAKHSMLDAIRTPDLAVEITLQPIRRFGMDAAIIFADILNPLIGLGFPLVFEEKRGPIFQKKIERAEDAFNLIVPSVEENVGYTLTALKILKQELSSSGRALIGFSGAPFTLSYYLIEGEGKHEGIKTKKFMREYPQAWRALQDSLVHLVSDYLIAQVNSGSDVVQIFDSWAWCLSPSDYLRDVFPYLKQIVNNVRRAVSTHIIYFAPAARGLDSVLPLLGADMLGVDWRISLLEVNDRLGRVLPLQGNLDPSALFGPIDYVEREVIRILDEGGRVPGHCFNLGHGVLPNTPPDTVARVVEWVQQYKYISD
jgi:uroporphyrinogen decarboxylase